MKRQCSRQLGRRVTVRFKEEDYQKIFLRYKSTTKQKLSEYIRAMMLEKPVRVLTRNKSLDDFMAEMILLRNELKAIGNNFNQAVKKLHIIQDDTEIKSWALLNENHYNLMMQKVSEINSKIGQISDIWLSEK